MLLPTSSSPLVACNIYVSAGRTYHSEILLSVLDRCLERCRLLRNGQIQSSANDYFQCYGHGNDTQSKIKNDKQKIISVIHAYADQIYDRSSFHLAGNVELVADVASFVSIDAMRCLQSKTYDCFNDGGTETKHPLIGLVDHISVMPLLQEDSSSYIHGDNNDIPSSKEDDSTCDSMIYTPPDPHGLCCLFIGNNLKQNDVDVLYYGSACSKQTPLSIIRREKTNFFNSGGLDKKVKYSEGDSYPNIMKQAINQCTIGSPSTFVENFNILLSDRVDKKQAMSLTKKIRARDGGVLGVEALTLPYSDDRYEVACNLLYPDVGSVTEILKVLDMWVIEEQRRFKEEHGIDYKKEDLVYSSYQVGTTRKQCLDILNYCMEENHDFFKDNDEAITQRFMKFLQ